MKRKHLIIRGIVQGVGFRIFAVECARKHNVAGFVRNLPTGDVEIVVEGGDKNVEDFVREVKYGPPSAIVEDVKIWEEPYKGTFKSFTIKF